MGLAAAGHAVGLGIASPHTLAETTALLGRAGMSLGDLDVCITNSGAEIWYCGADGETELDEGYVAMLEDKWDKVSQGPARLSGSRAPAARCQQVRPLRAEAGHAVPMRCSPGCALALAGSCLLCPLTGWWRRASLNPSPAPKTERWAPTGPG